MGKNLFGQNISGKILAALGGSLLPATLHSITAGTRTPGNLSGGTNPTEVPHSCRGMIDSQSRESINGTLVQAGNIVILLLGDSIDGGNTPPAVTDAVTIEGTRYNILAIDRDPDAATYTLLAAQA